MTFMILFDIFYIFKKSYTMSWYSFLECYSIQKTIKIILYKVYPLKATVGGVIRPQGVTIRSYDRSSDPATPNFKHHSCKML